MGHDDPKGPDREEIERAIAEVLAREISVAAAYLHGSVARGRTTPLSDVDVALVLNPDIPGRERLRLRLRVVDGLQRALSGRDFDVVILEEVPVAIAGRIVGEGALVFERDAVRRVAVEVATRMAYHDFLPFERRGTREGLRTLRERYGHG